VLSWILAKKVPGGRIRNLLMETILRTTESPSPSNYLPDHMRQREYLYVSKIDPNEYTGKNGAILPRGKNGPTHRTR
jgi:hypothetical protein